MTTWGWLIGAALAGAASFIAGWPALRAARARRTRDLNAERYLAWRGRAAPRVEVGLTRRERQRLVLAAVLGLVALFCLVGFVTYR